MVDGTCGGVVGMGMDHRHFIGSGAVVVAVKPPLACRCMRAGGDAIERSPADTVRAGVP